MVAEVANMSVEKIKGLFEEHPNLWQILHGYKGSEAPAADYRKRSPHKEILQPRIIRGSSFAILPFMAKEQKHTTLYRAYRPSSFDEVRASRR